MKFQNCNVCFGAKGAKVGRKHERYAYRLWSYYLSFFVIAAFLLLSWLFHLVLVSVYDLSPFLDASTHLYMRVCPSVGLSDGPSVGP